MMEFKKKYNLMLNSLTVQKTFYEAAEMCESSVMAENDTDGYIVDAKSVLGFYSLDLNKPVTITINSEEDANRIEKALLSKKVPFVVVA